tara:strand:- start:231 stop:749 length:519 start_codon:yes stop_codon:yes gene_type:complete
VVAVKALQMPKGKSARMSGRKKGGVQYVFDEFRREVVLMTMLVHPNVVALKVKVVLDRLVLLLLLFTIDHLQAISIDPYAMVVEMMDMGSLYDVIHDADIALSWAARVSLAGDCCKVNPMRTPFLDNTFHLCVYLCGRECWDDCFLVVRYGIYRVKASAIMRGFTGNGIPAL